MIIPKCKHCGYRCIEEVRKNVTVASEVRKITDQGSIVFFQEGDTFINEGDLVGYRCACCGTMLENITKPEELIQYIRSNQQ